MNNSFMKFFSWLMVAAYLSSCDSSSNTTSTNTLPPLPDELTLHVESPAWSDQIIYFVMIDRFTDGDPSNNSQSPDNDGAGYYRPAHPSYYSGGDLQGIINQLTYIQNIGATALWITPPNANQWWDPANTFSGYHGYWARDYKSVDEHYGTLDKYKELSHRLHARDMYLIQDIVPNHTGNFFTYTGAYDPENTADNFSIIANNVPVQAPIQSPFGMNDRNNDAHLMANIYHWTPRLNNESVESERFNYQLADLDDLNTENPVVIAALKDSFSHWIKEVGVDGFRIDTVKYIDHPFWNEFLHGDDGIEAAARATGRQNFLHFGEVFNGSSPLMDNGEAFLKTFEGTTAQPELDSLIGFPLYFEIERVLGTGGAPSGHLAYRLEQHMTYRNPHIVPNFIDNHDVRRFSSVSNAAGFRQALATLMTIPGIPVIWQGTGQRLLESRQTMFAGGHIGGNGQGTNERDMFDQTAPIYTLIKELADIRRGDPVFTRGDLTILAQNDSAPGVLIWRRSFNNEHGYVVMNTSDRKTLVNAVATGTTTPGAVLKNLHGESRTQDVVLGQNGELTMELAAREFMILKLTNETGTPTTTTASLTITNNYQDATLPETPPTLSGTFSENNATMRLIINGDLDNAVEFMSGSDGTWSTTFPANIYSLVVEEHNYQIYAPESNFVSDIFTFTTPASESNAARVSMSDPMDDDNGPTGNYIYPKDISYSLADGTSLQAADMHNVLIEHSGASLRITLTMGTISTVWNPVNGFDHTSIHIYFDLPDSTGLTAMPEQQSMTPTDFAWDLGQRSYGWGNAMFTTKGATATARGENAAGAPDISVDETSKTVAFTYSGRLLGVNSWENVKIYITTWDIDGIEDVLRNISPSGAQWHFGGAPETSAKIMDSIGPITIPEANTN